MDKITITAKELAEKYADKGVDQVMANSVLRFLVATNQAVLKEVRKVEGARGKGTNVYEMDATISLSL